MATYIWIGTAGDGSWGTPGNWSPNGIPGAGDTVTIDLTAAATIDVSNQQAGSVTINQFVTLTVANNARFTCGTISGTGTLSAASGAVVDLTGGGQLTETLSGAGTLQLDNAPYSLAAADVTIGTVNVESSAYLSDTGSTTLAGAVIDSGSVQVSGVGSTLTIGGGLSGFGTLQATVGAVADLTRGSVLTEVISGPGTLQLDNATYFLEPTAITIATVKIDAGATLSGADSLAGTVIDNGTLTASSIYGTLFLTGALSGTGTLSAGVGAVVDLTAGEQLTESISGPGTLQLDYSSFTMAATDNTIGTLKVDKGASLSGNGTLSGTVIDSGSVSASGGTLLVSGALSGTGALSAASGAVLDLTAGGTLTETLSGAGTLQLDDATYAIGAGGIAIGTVNLDKGAELSGSGTLWGKLTGYGTITAAAGGVIDLAGGGNFDGTLGGAGVIAIATATRLDRGAKLLAANVIDIANLTLASAAVTNATGNSFTIFAAAHTAVVLGSTGTGSSFTNAGTMLINGAGTARINAALVDSGSISVSSGTLLTEGAVSGTGALSIGAGATANLAAGGALTETISGAGSLILGGTTTLSNRDITVASVRVNATDALSGSGTLTGAVLDDGTISAAGGALQLAGKVSGNGTLAASAGAALDLAGGAIFAGTLGGDGTIAIAGSTTLQTGATLSAATVIESANLVLKSVAVTNEAASTFDITAAAGTTVKLASTGTGAFTNAGTLAANGAGLAAISAPFTNSGTVSALIGTLSFLGSIAGTGTLDLGAGATLSLGQGAGAEQTVAFLGTTGTLDLTNPLDFAGTITGFGGADRIFLEHTTFTTFGYTTTF